MLVHLKDKRTPQENAGVMYLIPCNDFPCVYTGETERSSGMREMREKEHQQDVRSLEEVKFTWARKKDLAITDHVTRNNHTIHWEGVKERQ